ncbi:hypothetical protein [Hafnia alvei]|jgi:hypothetical protein|nr:hypothetical protein [Hafnia alvei]
MKSTTNRLLSNSIFCPTANGITFTMSDKLWHAFVYNWPLLNKLLACAANILLK